MYLLESIGNWASFMMEPLETRVMLSVTVPLMDDVPVVKDAGGGRVVVAEQAKDLSSVMLLRLLGDGSPDPSFGQGGLVRLMGPWIVNDLIVLEDGKMLLLAGGGDFHADIYHASIYRLNSDGQIDSTFGSAGCVDLPSPSWQAWSSKMIVQEDGRIVAADVQVGQEGDYDRFPPDYSNLLVARYTPQGQPDLTFGNQGVIVTQTIPCWNVTAIDADSAGEIDVAVSPSGPADCLIARYNPNGSPVASFGQNGVAAIDLDGFYFWNMLPGGRLLAIGDPQKHPQMLQEYQLDGQVDASFGDNGAITITGVDWTWATSNPIGVSSRRIVLGMPTPAGTPEGSQQLIALNPDGSVDQSFGIDGRLILKDDPGVGDWIVGLSVSSNGEVVEAHVGGPDPWQNFTQLVVNRIDANGRPVAMFGDGGRVVLQMIDTEEVVQTPEPIADQPAKVENPDSAATPTPFASGAPFLDSADDVEADSYLLGITPERSLLGQLKDDALFS